MSQPLPLYLDGLLLFSCLSCPTLCDPIGCSTPGLPVPHYLLKFAKVHVHCISDAIQPSHPLMPSDGLLLLLSRFSRVQPSATPWTAAFQAPPSMGFSRQEYWRGAPLPSPLWVTNHLKLGASWGTPPSTGPCSFRCVAIALCGGDCGLVTKLCLTLCGPTDCGTPGLPVPHHLPKFAQVRVHCIGDARQPSHPLMPSSPSALNLFQDQGLIQ